MKIWKPLLFLIIPTLALMLVACAGGASGDPAQTVERYLQAKVEGHEQTVRSLLCSEMEANTFQEVNAFTSVSGAHIEGMKCQWIEGSDVVTCEGKIVATYGAEETEFPLAAYRVVKEDGEWKWCGETAPPQ
ncbi:MAG TPA: hypothetical protein EYP25_07340 [Anaerolineae bacterium]|nr:hypothetical protein [Caldilineae bacterium]HID34369.1 hypothetical protein [Anaerolineae bacterium]HIQ11661.1 hypothetical protein [Caldilineales bacterium]